MPSAPCLEVGCPGFATYRGRCETHAPARERETHDSGRVAHPASTHPPAGTPTPRIYDSKRWRLLRLKVIRLHPICQSCKAELSTIADHVVPIEEGGQAWALSNLQGLCARCHSSKTAAEVRARTYE
jgi:5-methylcytosine-specific restriction endonuclease McrA